MTKKEIQKALGDFKILQERTFSGELVDCKDVLDGTGSYDVIIKILEEKLNPWRDISTAPKDGRNIIITNPHGNTCVAHWGESISGEMCWIYAEDENFVCVQNENTHWMFIPERSE